MRARKIRNKHRESRTVAKIEMRDKIKGYRKGKINDEISVPVEYCCHNFCDSWKNELHLLKKGIKNPDSGPQTRNVNSRVSSQYQGVGPEEGRKTQHGSFTRERRWGTGKSE